MRINRFIPVIYCTGELRAVHKRWKMLLNSAAGKLAFSGEGPEFDHNEIVSWTEDDNRGEFILLMIRAETDCPLLDKITDSAFGVLSEKDLEMEILEIPGEILERGLCGLILADATVDCIIGGE